MNTTASTISSKTVRMIGGVAVAAGLAFSLAACSFSANLTVSADDIADLAETALGEQWGNEPDVDCGDESVAAVVDTEIECTAYNPNSGLEYPATVTITKVDGNNISIKVTTDNAIVDEDEEEEEEPEDPNANAPQVTASNLASLAAGALAEQLGYTPVIDCGREPISIYIGAEIECVATGDDGLEYPADITVTEVTETNYNIDVVMGATPIS